MNSYSKLQCSLHFAGPPFALEAIFSVSLFFALPMTASARAILTALLCVCVCVGIRRRRRTLCYCSFPIELFRNRIAVTTCRQHTPAAQNRNVPPNRRLFVVRWTYHAGGKGIPNTADSFLPSYSSNVYRKSFQLRQWHTIVENGDNMRWVSF